jgi:acetoin utilization protein AcuB
MRPIPSSDSGRVGLTSSQRTVRDVMRRDFITASVGESLLDAVRTMRLGRLRHLTVEREGVLIGVLSYRDLQDALLVELEREPVAGAASRLANTRVGERMIDTPASISPDAPLAAAFARIERLRIGCLPVVEPSENGPKLVGLVTELDLLRAAYEDRPPT